jgi:ribosomal-protein-alanine N-acetyltransferase
MNIREASADDAEAVISLIEELAESAGEMSAITPEHVAAYCSMPGSVILLAEEDERAVGLLSYTMRPGLFHAALSCLIDELIVHKPARGHGVGGALLQAVLARARVARCVEVSVSTMLDNARAIALYRRHGFTDEALLLEQHLGA